MWGNEVSQQATMCLMNVCTVGTNKPHSRSNTRRKFTFSYLFAQITRQKKTTTHCKQQTTQQRRRVSASSSSSTSRLNLPHISSDSWKLRPVLRISCWSVRPGPGPAAKVWLLLFIATIVPLFLFLFLFLPAYSPTTLESTFSLLMTLNVKSVLILLSSCLLTTKSSFSHYYQMIFLRFWFCYERWCCWFYWTVCVIVQSHSEYMLHS